MQTLTQQQLYYYITKLKKTVAAFGQWHGRNLVFINDISFYNHVRALPVSGTISNRVKKKRGAKDTTMTVNDVLDILEPYIPLTLTEDSFDLFIHAVKAAENGQEDLPDLFTQKAKVDFMVTLREIENNEQWEQLFNVCDTIRVLKEDLLLVCE